MSVKKLDWLIFVSGIAAVIAVLLTTSGCKAQTTRLEADPQFDAIPVEDPDALLVTMASQQRYNDVEVTTMKQHYEIDFATVVLPPWFSAVTIAYRAPVDNTFTISVERDGFTNVLRSFTYTNATTYTWIPEGAIGFTTSDKLVFESTEGAWGLLSITWGSDRGVSR